MKSLKTLMIAALTILATSVYGQDETTKKAKAPNQDIYSCTMHPEVTSGKPGKCSKCGMELTKTKMEVKKLYACPMHPGVTSDKPGKCAECGMDLKVAEQAVKTYSCSMHPEITSDKPGKCSKCGMDLKEKNP